MTYRTIEWHNDVKSRNKGQSNKRISYTFFTPVFSLLSHLTWVQKEDNAYYRNKHHYIANRIVALKRTVFGFFSALLMFLTKKASSAIVAGDEHLPF